MNSSNGWRRGSQYRDVHVVCEGAVRPFTIGRNSWFFSQSQAGASGCVDLCSLIEIAKMNGLNPYYYLKEVFTQLPSAETVGLLEACYFGTWTPISLCNPAIGLALSQSGYL